MNRPQVLALVDADPAAVFRFVDTRRGRDGPYAAEPFLCHVAGTAERHSTESPGDGPTATAPVLVPLDPHVSTRDGLRRTLIIGTWTGLDTVDRDARAGRLADAAAEARAAADDVRRRVEQQRRHRAAAAARLRDAVASGADDDELTLHALGLATSRPSEATLRSAERDAADAGRAAAHDDLRPGWTRDDPDESAARLLMRHASLSAWEGHGTEWSFRPDPQEVPHRVASWDGVDIGRLLLSVFDLARVMGLGFPGRYAPDLFAHVDVDVLVGRVRGEWAGWPVGMRGFARRADLPERLWPYVWAATGGGTTSLGMVTDAVAWDTPTNCVFAT